MSELMKIGAQTYTCRMFMQSERDFRQAMKNVADIGYEYVQISGIGPLKPQFIRDVCDESGLKIVLTHTKMDIVNDVDSVIKYHEILGCKYIGIGGSGEKYRTEGWMERFGEDYYKPALAMKEAGFRFMYHTHSDEWGRAKDGELILDKFLKGMPEDVMGLTLDLYWLQYTGANVLAWIDKLQNRLQCVHVKDMGIVGNQQVMLPVGEGNMDYVSIIDKLRQLGKTEYLLVEQDNCNGRNPFECLNSSYDFLKKTV